MDHLYVSVQTDRTVYTALTTVKHMFFGKILIQDLIMFGRMSETFQKRLTTIYIITFASGVSIIYINFVKIIQ